jgi:hypothetical protein
VAKSCVEDDGVECAIFEVELSAVAHHEFELRI